MSQETESKKRPEPADTLWQAAELAAHLARMGTQWLPAPNPATVEILAAQFQPSPVDGSQGGDSASPDSAPPDSASPDSASPDSATAASPAISGAPTAGGTQESKQAEPFSLAADHADSSQPYPGPSLATTDRDARLAQLANQVDACTRCEILSKCRTKTVFGEGNLSPRIVFFGEGPGRDEDLSGRPFVGKAGQLLTKMIQACKFAREDVYIMNTVKCRPPNNRNPEQTEIENCREYFEAQLDALRPEYIVCLGLISAQALLRNKLSVGMMRGKFHRYFDSKVVVTYHPSYLLRTPAAKKAAWDDLQMMLRDAGLM